jgi:hypothetical protein
MTAKYTVLGNTTLATASSSVTFSSIPSGYKDLVLVLSVATTSGTTRADIQFNNDTGSNYSYVYMRGDGSASSSAATGETKTYAGLVLNGGQGVFVSEIMDYSATNKHKTMLTRSNPSNYGVWAFANRWANTSAINQIELLSGATYPAGSTFRLLGVN